MKKVILILSTVIITTITFKSCGDSSIVSAANSSNNDAIEENSEVASIKEISIGTQVWTTENLNVEKFRNGDDIPQVKTKDEWIKAGDNKQPAWCYFKIDIANGAKYGKLYNWYAVNDARGLAPIGFHIPSEKEWEILSTYLGGRFNAGTKMKSTFGWDPNSNNHKATNISGFSALPGGGCGQFFTFFGAGYHGGWWSSTTFGNNSAWGRRLINTDGDLDPYSSVKAEGISVRCVRD